MAHSVPALSAAALLLACATGRTAAGRPVSERLTWVEGGAGRLRVSDGGAGGTPVVFVHGLGSDLEVWRAQLDHLRTGRRAIAYDQRGHGASDPAGDGVYTIDALADDLEAVRAALDLPRMVLVGHSMSGLVLTTYAGRHPERVAGLVYVDATGDARPFPPAAVAQLIARETAPSFGRAEQRAVFEEMLVPPTRPATRAAVLASLARIDPPAFGLLRKELVSIVDGPERLAPYRGPAVAIEGGDEVWVGSAAARLGVRRVAVPGVGHWIQLDDPEAVSRELDAFLAGL